MAWAGEALVRRLADGDTGACAEFYDRYAPLAYPVILHIVGDPDLAADVLRDVFWEAWEAAGSYDARRSPEAWIVARARARAVERARGTPAAAAGVAAAIRSALERLRAAGPTPATGHEPHAGRSRAYAAGALPPAERVEFEAHLAGGCASCAAMVRAHGETLADLARQAPPLAPPDGVRAELVRRVAAEAAPRTSWRRRRRLRWILGSLAAVVGVAAFAAGLGASRYEARIGAMARETARVRADLRRQHAALGDRVAAAQGLVELLLDPATRSVTLRGPAPGTGRVLWNEGRGGQVLVADLPPAPAGSTYALWAIVEGRPQGAGSVTIDASGRGVRALPPLDAGVRGFRVTLEPVAGTPVPTGPVVLASP
jgi:DNA-directed RNA polymerase specialized sigma24 family protein